MEQITLRTDNPEVVKAQMLGKGYVHVSTMKRENIYLVTFIRQIESL